VSSERCFPPIRVVLAPEALVSTIQPQTPLRVLRAMLSPIRVVLATEAPVSTIQLQIPLRVLCAMLFPIRVILAPEALVSTALATQSGRVESPT
jgi:hypothetical protein